MRALVGLTYAFLLAAPLCVLMYSFSASVVLELPPTELTWRWYQNVLSQPRLLRAIVFSTLVASAASASAIAAGVPAAYAITRGRIRSLATFFLSPLVVPGIILALGLLMGLRRFAPSTLGSMWPLVLAHMLVTIPWVIRTVSANLELIDPAQEEAARSLGATPLQAFFLVTLPSIRPGIITGAAFAFIVSFGNFALSLFFTGASVTTLPVALFEYIDQFQDPTVAAASSLVILATTVVVVLASGLRKMELP